MQLDDGSVVSESVVVARRVAADFASEDINLLPVSAAAEIDSFVELWTGRVEPAYYKVLTASTEPQARTALSSLLETLTVVEDRLWQRRMLDG